MASPRKVLPGESFVLKETTFDGPQGTSISVDGHIMPWTSFLTCQEDISIGSRIVGPSGHLSVVSYISEIPDDRTRCKRPSLTDTCDMCGVVDVNALTSITFKWISRRTGRRTHPVLIRVLGGGKTLIDVIKVIDLDYLTVLIPSSFSRGVLTFESMIDFYGALAPSPHTFMCGIGCETATFNLDCKSSLSVGRAVTFKIGQLVFSGFTSPTGDEHRLCSPSPPIPISQTTIQTTSISQQGFPSDELEQLTCMRSAMKTNVNITSMVPKTATGLDIATLWTTIISVGIVLLITTVIFTYKRVRMASHDFQNELKKVVDKHLRHSNKLRDRVLSRVSSADFEVLTTEDPVATLRRDTVRQMLNLERFGQSRKKTINHMHPLSLSLPRSPSLSRPYKLREPNAVVFTSQDRHSDTDVVGYDTLAFDNEYFQSDNGVIYEDDEDSIDITGHVTV